MQAPGAPGGVQRIEDSKVVKALAQQFTPCGYAGGAGADNGNPQLIVFQHGPVPVFADEFHTYWYEGPRWDLIMRKQTSNLNPLPPATVQQGLQFQQER